MWIILCNFAAKFYLYMKKEVRIIVLFAAMIAFSVSASAQLTHSVGGWVQGEYLSYLSDINGELSNQNTFVLNSSQGGGGGAGVLYEMRVRRHFLIEAGVGFNFAGTAFDLSGQDYLYPMPGQKDASGNIVDCTYQFANRKDVYLVPSVQIPLMVGGEFGNFYCLAGVKLDISDSVSTKIKYNLTDPNGIDLEGIVPSEYLESTKISTKLKDPAFNVHFQGELGFRFGKVYKVRGYDVPNPRLIYRLALFAEWGPWDICIKEENKDNAKSLYSGGTTEKKEEGDVAEFDFINSFTDVLNSKEVITVSFPEDKSESTKKYLSSLMVGVKFTVLFRLPEKKKGRVYYDEPLRSSHGILE